MSTLGDGLFLFSRLLKYLFVLPEETSDTLNYRCISRLPLFGKILDAVIISIRRVLWDKQNDFH